MKQYVHPTIDYLSVNHTHDGYYNIINKSYEGEDRILYVEDAERNVSEETLTKLGFIEKEEEPDTDTKWIEDVYKDLNKYYDLTLDMLEDSILSHIPKQWKTQATHEI